MRKCQKFDKSDGKMQICQRNLRKVVDFLRTHAIRLEKTKIAWPESEHPETRLNEKWTQKQPRENSTL